MQVEAVGVGFADRNLDRPGMQCGATASQDVEYRRRQRPHRTGQCGLDRGRWKSHAACDSPHHCGSNHTCEKKTDTCASPVEQAREPIAMRYWFGFELQGEVDSNTGVWTGVTRGRHIGSDLPRWLHGDHARDVCREQAMERSPVAGTESIGAERVGGCGVAVVARRHRGAKFRHRVRQGPIQAGPWRRYFRLAPPLTCFAASKR